MKDFCKWLGVNEKIAKIVVWLFIFICMLIMGNTLLESIGLPYYRITAENLSKVDVNMVVNYLSSWTMILLSFYSVIFLVFPISKFKDIFKWSVLYLILNIVIASLFGYMATQIYIFVYQILFCYFYSKKNWKYAIYGVGSYILSVFVQYICYLYKIRFIDFTILNRFTKLVISLDFFVISVVMILVKEIYLKRKEKNN